MKCIRALLLLSTLTLFYPKFLSAKNDVLIPATFAGASVALLVATQAKNPLIAAGLSAVATGTATYFWKKYTETLKKIKAMNYEEFKDFIQQEHKEIKLHTCTRKEVNAEYTIKSFLAQCAAITSLLTTGACLAKGAYKSYKKEIPKKND